MHANSTRSDSALSTQTFRCVVALIAGLWTSSLALAQEQWIEVRKLTAKDGQTNAYLGSDVCLTAGRAIISAPLDHGAGPFAGAVYEFDSATGEQRRKMVEPVARVEGRFGRALACSGDVAIVGACESERAQIPGSSSYLCDLRDGTIVHRLYPSEPFDHSAFGISVAIDDELVLVGAPSGYLRHISTGAAYVFDLETGRQWLRLWTPDIDNETGFGATVALSGRNAIVSAYRDSRDAPNAGSVYVFDVVTGAQVHHLRPLDPVEGMAFGDAVAVHGDRVAISAYHDNVHGPNSGSVYLFDLVTGQQLLKIAPADGREGASFGRSVAIDDQRLVVGAAHDDENGFRSGAVYVFDLASGNQLAKLVASDGAESDQFGTSVDIEADRILVGARGVDDRGWLAGAAYVFERVHLLAEPDRRRAERFKTE